MGLEQFPKKEQKLQITAENVKKYIKGTLEAFLNELKEEHPGGVREVFNKVVGSKPMIHSEMRERIVNIADAISEQPPTTMQETEDLIEKLNSPEIKEKIESDPEGIWERIK
ncbi:hypothetical protein A2755_02705 [Candidatus Wolfebacteria bacterium RIFCSPHIGHO2_01_FULL_48_22]|uniref:Uncharacterized protein n=2 Tax=Candidatus Wolfeibacteriota TaxID=1752735 RepID=A0A1F8DS52_9BACT|nr:MAG: hypothetical protein A2755_02705 [Candidatus Wolfebacteria bacterium RIFCSPHIGHO2_01_FULL_48_22]OGM92219.1 MAG: hypothetical protein A2935_00360 [Candidatus Wolfebacteria bacterium RIFCSPLOWO2_01_FULL_47_17b]